VVEEDQGIRSLQRIIRRKYCSQDARQFHGHLLHHGIEIYDPRVTRWICLPCDCKPYEKIQPLAKVEMWQKSNSITMKKKSNPALLHQEQALRKLTNSNCVKRDPSVLTPEQSFKGDQRALIDL
jgi:hypothetical protein